MCPSCGGPLGLMGTLGTMDHWRCRNCGQQVNIERIKTMHESITIERILPMVEESMFGESNIGICLDCGEEQGSCEPDATGHHCESCGMPAVSGVEEILLTLQA